VYPTVVQIRFPNIADSSAFLGDRQSVLQNNFAAGAGLAPGQVRPGILGGHSCRLHLESWCLTMPLEKSLSDLAKVLVRVQRTTSSWRPFCRKMVHDSTTLPVFSVRHRSSFFCWTQSPFSISRVDRSLQLPKLDCLEGAHNKREADLPAFIVTHHQTIPFGIHLTCVYNSHICRCELQVRRIHPLQSRSNFCPYLATPSSTPPLRTASRTN
jgi:hypothetical protein